MVFPTFFFANKGEEWQRSPGLVNERVKRVFVEQGSSKLLKSREGSADEPFALSLPILPAWSANMMPRGREDAL